MILIKKFFFSKKVAIHYMTTDPASIFVVSMLSKF
jgi:hypothetical protein